MNLLNRFRLISTILLLVVPWWIASVHAQELGQPLSAATEPLVGNPVVVFDGDITVRYQFRAADSLGRTVFDHDLYQQLYLNLFRPEDRRFEFVLAADLREDLDGERGLTGFYPFEDLGDTGSESVTAKVYEAYADFKDLSPALSLLRLGRQTGMLDVPLYYDGITVQLRALRILDLIGYAGMSVHFDELGYTWGSDRLAGVGVELRALESTRFGLDYLFVTDTRRTPFDSDQYNHQLGLVLWQRIASLARFRLRFRLTDFAPRDLSVQTMLTFNSIGLELNADYTLQIRSQEEQANELSVYYDVVGISAPFQSIDFKARQLLGTFFAMDIGGYYRHLLAGEADGVFNREYGRIFALIEVSDLPLPGLSLSPIGELWFSGDNMYYSAGLDLTYNLQLKQRNVLFQAGSDFSLYKYDYYEELGEREQVQTYFVKAQVPFGDGFAAKAAYEFERGLEPYRRLSLRLRYGF